MEVTDLIEQKQAQKVSDLKVNFGALGEPFYRGSVQNLYAIPGDSAHMACETTSGGSVFDVGTIFKIPNSDLTRSIFRHKVFTGLEDPACIRELLASLEPGAGESSLPAEWLQHSVARRAAREGIRTHHRGMADAKTGEVVSGGFPAHPSTFNAVRRFQIIKPVALKLPVGWVYDYSPYRGQDGFVVPLEYIVRLGITSGSSVFRKYQKMPEAQRRDYARRLGAGDELKAWEYFSQPIYDLTTKYEPEDRNLENQEALLISTLSGERFVESVLTVILCTAYVAKLMQEMGLRLWDIKWELAREGDDLYVVDTIDTDSLRATFTVAEAGRRFVTHFNKQSMRDYYKIAHADWMDAVNATKASAGESGRPFTELLKEAQALGEAPRTPEVDATFLDLQTRKMDFLANFLLGNLQARAARETLEQLAREEVAYYRGGPGFEKFCELNEI